jgi:hypothetical protein
MRVGGHLPSPSRRFGHRRLDLGVGILLRARGNALRQHGSSRQNFDEVGAELEIGPHGLRDLVGTVGQIPDDGHVDVQRKLTRVAGAAG